MNTIVAVPYTYIHAYQSHAFYCNMRWQYLVCNVGGAELKLRTSCGGLVPRLSDSLGTRPERADCKMATKATLQSLKSKEKYLQEEIEKFRGIQKGEVRLLDRYSPTAHTHMRSY